MIERFLPQASSYASDIDFVITLITVLVGVWWILTEGVLIGMVVAFRERKGVKGKYITGTEKHEKRWIGIPHELVLVCDIVIVIGAIKVWVDVKQDLPPAEQTVRVIGQQWAWTFQHPGPDGQIDTDDDIFTVDELRLQVNTVYHYKLVARDVIHNFSVPVFRLKQDAIPGREITGWFKPIMTGRFDIQCAEICGVGHGLMPGVAVIESKQAHAEWVAANSDTKLAALTAK